MKKLLIANRGEIAVRIIRACKELNITSVAIFSEPDRLSPHVLHADEAYPLYGKTSQESYLSIEKILSVLKSSAADAVHPGYGFLSENQRFAELVRKSGYIFVGPSSDSINTMGNKTNARKKMLEASVPCIPGTEEGISNIKQAKQIAEKIGYPILIKAALGGGGKGMRIVHKSKELTPAITRAQNEAKQAFGNPLVYIEKYLIEPRHIEIQILGDTHGNYVHLFERECSIQRRHQKVLEEAPSPLMTKELRHKMTQSAIDCAKAAKYFSAGTVEFLVDQNFNYYFLEMNTRIQVEHPITEMVTGVDIVKEMISISEGNPLSVKQKDIKIRGHAIEARIYAEDIYENFMPSVGHISVMKAPGGPGIREDSGFQQKNTITSYYDSMLSKLCAWGNNRQEAIFRMERALKEYQLAGVKTTIPFCLMILEHPSFKKGRYNTRFVELYLKKLIKKEEDYEELVAISTILVNILEKEEPKISSKSKRYSNWIKKRYE